MKKITIFILLILMIQSIIGLSQDCGEFELFNFTNVIVTEDWQWDEPRNGFYFDMTYDTLKVFDTNYISFYLVNESNDTITQKDYHEWSRYFPKSSNDTVRYTMVLDSNYTSLPLNFSGYLMTSNPECQIPVSFSTSVSEPEIVREEIKVFPNPTKGTLFFERAFKDIRVYDLQGKTIMKKAHGNSIDLSAINPGIYILWVSHEGYEYTRKVIKQ